MANDLLDEMVGGISNSSSAAQRKEWAYGTRKRETGCGSRNTGTSDAWTFGAVIGPSNQTRKVAMAFTICLPGRW